MATGWRKTVCKRGHPTPPGSRYTNGGCAECVKQSRPTPRPAKVYDLDLALQLRREGMTYTEIAKAIGCGLSKAFDLLKGYKVGHAWRSPTCKRGHVRTPETTYSHGGCRVCRWKDGVKRPDRKTHCIRGHERTPENLNGAQCRVCKRELYLARRVLKPKRTHCRNGHEKTPENQNSKGGCRVCAKAARLRCYARNPEPSRARARARYYKHRERISARSRAYYQENLERLRAKGREYSQKNKKRIQAYRRAHYLLLNPGKGYARTKKWRQENPEKYREVNRKAYQKMKDLYGGCISTDGGARAMWIMKRAGIKIDG